MILTVEDCVRSGFCVKGQVRFCKAHDINYRDFVRFGLSFEELTHIEDANLQRAISQAESRQQEA